MRTSSALVLLSLVSGCVSYRLEAPAGRHIAADALPPAGLGQICVLRPHISAGAVTFTVRDDGVLVGATRGPSYFCYYAAPGEHVIETRSDGKEESTISVAAGSNYYLQEDVDNVLGYVKSRSSWVAPQAVPALLEACGYRVLTGVPGNEKLPDAEPMAPAKG
ncbi:MAG: DUF2846 domain-containing protein [Polyangia bacterium]